MQIKRICYPVNVLGPGKRVGIWLCGCRFNCPGCMTPELQDFSAGNKISVKEIIDVIKKIPHKIDGFTISGGEPFEQAQELNELVEALVQHFTDDIIVYSGYYYDELKQNDVCKKVLENIAVLIDGRYIDEENDGKGLKGSKNQNIIIFKNPERYSYMQECERELQILNYRENSSLVIGLL